MVTHGICYGTHGEVKEQFSEVESFLFLSHVGPRPPGSAGAPLPIKPSDKTLLSIKSLTLKMF